MLVSFILTFLYWDTHGCTGVYFIVLVQYTRTTDEYVCIQIYTLQ